MRNYFKLRTEESLMVVRAMLNEDSLDLFPKMTRRQQAWVRRLMAVCEGESYAVPRKHLRMVRPPQRLK